MLSTENALRCLGNEKVEQDDPSMRNNDTNNIFRISSTHKKVFHNTRFSGLPRTGRSMSKMSSRPSRFELESSSSGPPPPIPYTTIKAWKSQCHFPYSPATSSSTTKTLNTSTSTSTSLSDFLTSLPKIELHVHIEGTMTSALRFKLAKKHGMLPIRSERLGKEFWDEESLEREVYGGLLGVRSVKGKGVSAFFEAYYGMSLHV